MSGPTEAGLARARGAVLRLGTRRSALAMTQSTLVARRVEEALSALAGPEVPSKVELVEVSTTGDESGAPLTSFGGVGVFVSRLREELLAGRIDLAVHSLKDLPTAPAEGLVLAAIPTREDPRDALICRDGLSLDALPHGALIGTGSPRRAAQLRAVRPDLQIVDVRGNVDTRLGRVRAGDLDGVVLAMAGLRRLGRENEVTEALGVEVMLPAPGQGALAVECRSEDRQLRDWLAALDDPRTRAAVEAERALLAAVEAGCAAPLGALAQVMDGDASPTLRLEAIVSAVDGAQAVRQYGEGPLDQATELGRQVADRMLSSGAGELLSASTTPNADRLAGGNQSIDRSEGVS